MDAFMQQYGIWIVLGLVAYVIIIKIRRHRETAKINGQSQTVFDAEEMVVAIARAVKDKEPDALKQVQLVNEVVTAVKDGNSFKRALVDSLANVCTETPEKKFTPVAGEHPLDALAGRAIEAEETKSKVTRGLKTAGRIGLGLLKGGLL